MRYWIGAALLLASLPFIQQAMARRAVAARAWKALPAPTRDEEALSPNSMTAFGEVMTPIVLFALGYLAVKITFAFVYFGGAQVLSVFDLVGGYVFLLAYGYWLKTKTSVRMPDTVTGTRERVLVGRDTAPWPAFPVSAELARHGNRTDDVRAIDPILASRGSTSATQNHIGLE